MFINKNESKTLYAGGTVIQSEEDEFAVLIFVFAISLFGLIYAARGIYGSLKKQFMSLSLILRVAIGCYLRLKKNRNPFKVNLKNLLSNVNFVKLMLLRLLRGITVYTRH